MAPALAPAPAPAPATDPEPRRSGNYPPSIWTPFLESLQASDEQKDKILAEKISVLTEKVGKFFRIKSDEPLTNLLALVDVAVQLGLGYHLEADIKYALDQISSNMSDMIKKGDLHVISVLFRLMRHYGYIISQDIFKNYMDENGNFQTSTTSESSGVIGLLSLYEASYYGYEGEDILDKAKTFTTTSLAGLMENGDQIPYKNMIIYALELPIRRRMMKLHARWFIDIYSQAEEHNDELLELAKIRFKQTQHAYQRELNDIYRWWKKLDLLKQMPYARDRLVELYFFASGAVPEPEFSKCRVKLSMAGVLIAIVDDMYDIYGTVDELQVFTNAIERWDIINAMEQLPVHMKSCFLAVFNHVNEMAYELLTDGGIDTIEFLKKQWIRQCKSYLVEAKWYHRKYTPKIEEYLETSHCSIGMPLLSAYDYIMRTPSVHNEMFECVGDGNLELIRWFSTGSRLLDDWGTSPQESKRGDNSKSIECCMKEKGVSEETARAEVRAIVDKCWKKMNKARLKEQNQPKHLVEFMVDAMCTFHVVYRYEDGVGFPNKFNTEQMFSIFVTPLSEVVC